MFQTYIKRFCRYFLSRENPIKGNRVSIFIIIINITLFFIQIKINMCFATISFFIDEKSLRKYYFISLIKLSSQTVYFKI